MHVKAALTPDHKTVHHLLTIMSNGSKLLLGDTNFLGGIKRLFCSTPLECCFISNLFCCKQPPAVTQINNDQSGEAEKH